MTVSFGPVIAGWLTNFGLLKNTLVYTAVGRSPPPLSEDASTPLGGRDRWCLPPPDPANYLVEHMKPLRKDIDPGEKEENLLEIWNQFFEHVAEHARLYRAMLGKNGSPWFAARMREHTIKLMLERERQQEHQGRPRHQLDAAMPEELPAMQLSHVLIGTISWWLESEESYTPRQMATWFYRFAFYGYLSARGYEVPPPGKE